MTVARFDHINILTADIDGVRDFLVTVLGLREGERPPLRSPGYWLYQGAQAVFHISDSSNHEQTHLDDIGAVQTSAKHSAVDHIAFRCQGYVDTTQLLRRLGYGYHEADVPDRGDHQVFVDGPDGITLELIFAKAEVEATGVTAGARAS